MISFLPIIFYPLVGATGTLEIQENFETATKLKLSNIRYKTLAENIPDVVYSASPYNKFEIRFINSNIKSLCGYSAQDFYFTSDIFSKIIHPDDREHILKKYRKITKNVSLHYRIIHKETGALRYIIDHAIPVKEDNKSIAIEGIIVDITNEVKGKQRLSALMRELINAQENERKRIAKELHDEAGQALSAIKINLKLMENNLGNNSPKLKHAIENTDKLVDNLIVDIKRIALDLRPSILDDLGLKAALRSYIEEFKSRTNIEVVYNIRGFKRRLPTNIEIAFYRIIQEALTNIIKHSSADNVIINIKEGKETIDLTIRDNGRGFHTGKAFNPDTRGIGFGIIGIQERVKNLGGDFHIESEKGKGTQLSLNVPLCLK